MGLSTNVELETQVPWTLRQFYNERVRDHIRVVRKFYSLF